MEQERVDRARSDESRSTTVVLVHGGWHCPSSWGDVPDLLDRAGHRVVTVQMPGHGTDARMPESYLGASRDGFAEEPTSAPPVTLEAASRGVQAAAGRARARGDRVVVVHSSAGAVLSWAVEDEPEPFGWGSVPRTYITTRADRSIAPAAQDVMIDDADALCPSNPFRRRPMDTSHSPFASQPERLVDLLVQAAEDG